MNHTAGLAVQRQLQNVDYIVPHFKQIAFYNFITLEQIYTYIASYMVFIKGSYGTTMHEVVPIPKN